MLVSKPDESRRLPRLSVGTIGIEGIQDLLSTANLINKNGRIREMRGRLSRE
jgi:hypothetical protein